jgi:hypothetical protein
LFEIASRVNNRRVVPEVSGRGRPGVGFVAVRGDDQGKARMRARREKDQANNSMDDDVSLLI